ncbi:MAG: response regulator [Vulcanimicrobiota bacterium]
MAKQVRVLVLEDDPTLREVLRDVLEARGLHVTSASRGEEALEKARIEPYDLIVADIRMEGITGLDAIERARELQPDMGSIVVSGFASEEETLRAVKLNVAGYLKKPFKIPELLELINGYLLERKVKAEKEEETRTLREALLWSLGQQGAWAEKAHPGKVERPANLARALARAQGHNQGLGEQVFLGLMLRAIGQLTGQTLPTRVQGALHPFQALLEAVDGSPVGDFALAVVTASPDAWPPLEGLPDQVPGPLKEAYARFLEAAGQDEPEPEDDDEPIESMSLLSLALTLEQVRDLEGARRAYSQLLEQDVASSHTLQANLGLARLAVAQASTEQLEQRVTQTLALAGRLGPLSLAQSELEAARLLRQAGHPAAVKLFERARASLEGLDLAVPRAVCVLALAALDADPGPALLTSALQALAEADHEPEVVESLPSLLPDLLEVARVRPESSAVELARQFVRSFPHLLTGAFASMSAATQKLALELLAQSQVGLPDSLVPLLEASEQSELRSFLQAFEPARAESSRTLLRVQTMGGMVTHVGEQQVGEKEWKTQKVKYLLARLLAVAPGSLHVELVIEEFWPKAPERGRKNVNTSVSSLRKCLRDAGLEEELDPVERAGERLALNPRLLWWNDSLELVKAHERAQSLANDNPEKALAACSRVVRLYRGPYLDGCYMDWAIELRQHYERIYEQALLQLMESRFAQHRYREAFEYSTEYLRIQPDDMRAHELTMLCLLGLSRHQQAIDHYEAYRKELMASLGSEPAIELVKVYQMARYGFAQSSGLAGL